MDILLVTSTYPTPLRPRQGAFNRVMVEALRRRHRVQVIAPIPWPQLRIHQSRDPAEADTQHPISYFPPKILRHRYHQFYWQSIRNSVDRLPADFSPAVVLGYWLHPDSAAALMAAKQFNVPCVTMSGGTDLRILTRGLKRRRAIVRVLQQADRVIVFSDELRRTAERFGVPVGKMDVIYRGVNREQFSPGSKTHARRVLGLREDAVVLCWAGRLAPVKNPTMLLQACVRWKQYWGCRLKLLLIGDGPLRGEIQRTIDRLDLSDCVRLEGNLTQADLANRYRAADATVLTSHSEGTPNVLLESIACGTPFAATNVGGVSEIATVGLDHLVDDGDVPAMVREVITIVEKCDRSCPRTFVPTDQEGMARAFEATLAIVLDGREQLRTQAEQRRAS